MDFEKPLSCYLLMAVQAVVTPWSGDDLPSATSSYGNQCGGERCWHAAATARRGWTQVHHIHMQGVRRQWHLQHQQRRSSAKTAVAPNTSV